ncbi:MAG: ATP-binding protein [Saprospiraceae bacterium]
MYKLDAMITSLEISGFKTFTDFKIHFSPFVALAGLNAVGKSNLFDAIQLLSDLADFDIRTAFSQQRGEAIELFTADNTGGNVEEMKFAVELLVDKTVKDKWGGEEQLKYTRLRYELCIKRVSDTRNVEKLVVTNESLAPIQKNSDGWYKKYVGSKDEYWRPPTSGGRVPFISTKTEESTGLTTINLHQDRGSRGRPRPASDLESTMLSSVTNTEFPHALAVRNEMMNWQFLQLNPSALRKSSSKYTFKQTMSPDGSDLAGAMFILKTENPNLLKHISRDMARFVNDVVEIDVKEDETEKSYVIWIKDVDGKWFSSQVLSEGTLRLIALCYLKYAGTGGLICFEEPENGINPTRMTPLLKLLASMSTDFSQQNTQLRQILVNTHSPKLIAVIENILKTENNSLTTRISVFLARLSQHVSPSGKSKRTIITPVNQSGNVLPFTDENGIPDVEISASTQSLKSYLEMA